MKCCFLGDSGVGKTSLFNRLSNPTGFDLETLSTVGSSEVSIELEYKQQTFNISLADTAGQERFRSIAPMMIRNSSIILFCFQKDRPETFFNLSVSPVENAKSWIDTVSETKSGDYFAILILTQCDKECEGCVPDEQKELCATIKTKLNLKHDVPFIKTSAKDNIGIAQLETQICEFTYEYQKLLEQKPSPPSPSPSPNTKPTTPNCCN